ncbi:Lsr2 family protein [Streptomyces sp. HNM0574]|uniref:histone-like nucleoid-structuring protein Lsr2 n=1 Tax=Streptomyces sp. HNM0574 TaxID=2714954 RepID=UPI00146ABD82|nr:Lsr2 family protein [Streptomyces sp. HNM0574]NLU68956.1 Lsr2 family protein [Streptomyces sp. HNM0574]
MAQKVQIIYTDDLTGEESEDIQTHEFSLNGVYYQMDLTPGNYDQLNEALNPFIAKAQRVKKSRKAVAGASRKQSSSTETAKIREWAKAQGYEVNERGRIPANIQEAYAKAH